MTYVRGTPARHAAANLRRLRWIGFALPIVGLVVIEAFRFMFIEDVPLQEAEHAAIGAIAAIGILAFAVLMFRLIDRAESQVIRQNRELTAINAVSTAVQGELAVEQIIDAALEVVSERTGASEASVTVFNRQPGGQPALERRLLRTPHTASGPAGEQMPHLIEIPLAHGTSIVGRLRLHLASDALEPDVLTSATLSNIGHQLACSIEIGQLVGSLQRRESEDRGLYDVLLRISSQKALAETLLALAQHARGLLDADAVQIRLTAPTAAMIESLPIGGDATALAQRGEDGGFTISATRAAATATATATAGATAKAARAGERLRLSLTSPEMAFGELSVTRAPGTQDSEREWGLIHRIAELAVIAISAARMREREQQMAVLAERERIAREMHDSLAQVLGFIHLRLVALKEKVARIESPPMNANLDELTSVAHDAYLDVREAILGLRESSHAGRSLFENLRAYLERYEHQAAIETSFETDFDQPPMLMPAAEIHVIRVIQEALTNTRKHARARKVTVRATTRDGLVAFIVEDDGRGFNIADVALSHEGGFGLQAMRERMELIGGSVSIDSAPGRGTRIVALVAAVADGSAISAEERDVVAAR
ncbi:MAG: sensor histidine kinase [Candidatus Limnocylindrales bacterium]